MVRRSRIDRPLQRGIIALPFSLIDSNAKIGIDQARHVKLSGAYGFKALEAARRLARENLSVLLICFNRVLGEYLRLQITADDGRIQVWPLHQFMHELIISTGFGDRLREAETQAESATDLFQNHYPELFEAAVIESVSSDAHPTFDALIIDEAQDILFSPTIDAVETVNGGAKLVPPGGAKLVHLTLCGTRCWGVVPVVHRRDPRCFV